MKKAYVKPEVYFESFELSASIATACGYPIRTVVENSCGLPIAGIGTAFISMETGCEKVVPDGYNGYCYHNSSDALKLFNSQ